MTATLSIACFQLNATAQVEDNIAQIEALLPQAAQQLCWCFPECALFRPQVPTQTHAFSRNDETLLWFNELAKTHQKWIILGSVFLTDPLQTQATNTCLVFAPSGDCVAHYDKMHLFDATVGNTSFAESVYFRAGTHPKTLSIASFKCGLSICYDLRFPELYRYYSQQQCDVLFIPSSFTKRTGALHWHALCQARAIENQCYVIAPNQYGTGAYGSDTYGHSLIIDPEGVIIAEAPATGSTVITATLDQAHLQAIRTLFPVLGAKRL